MLRLTAFGGRKLADRLEAAFVELGDAGLRCPLVNDRPDSGMRRRVVGPYNLFYRFDGDVVKVARILHAARDSTRLLFPDD